MFLEYWPGPYEFALTAFVVSASIWAIVAAIFHTPPEDDDVVPPAED